MGKTKADLEYENSVLRERLEEASDVIDDALGNDDDGDSDD